MQFKGKLINQTKQNDKKNNSGSKKNNSNFFPWVLPLLDVINFYKLPLYAISRKTNEPNLKKWQKNPSFGVDFGPFDPNLGPK